jgi:preprotein translocase SecF subunit
MYGVNENDIRIDVGLTKESDISGAQLQITDIRNSLPIFFKKYDITVSELSFVSVGNSFGKFVLDRAYLTLVVCFISIAFYLMYAFRDSIEGTSSVTFGTITLATLLHDIIVSSGIFVILGLIFPVLKIDTFFVTAILTILGFSINDTIVILDRIRSNYKAKKSQDQRSSKQIFEESIQVSLRRSLYTSMTLLIVLTCMLLFGPEALVGFTTLMFLGTIVGTYSSICLAAPVLYDINSSKKIS